MLFILTLFGKLLPLEPSAWQFLAGLIACSCVISPSAVAQIIPDNTLGDESSVVVPEVEINGIESDILEGGAIRGSNLFHSFQEFNIDAGRGAYFANPAAIENIFSRVTGVNPSEIFGTLGVLGNANLFLINPNGIIFGKNASLDLRGSFVGTTADSIIFRSGKEFSATNPGVPPLLTVNVEQPIGLKFEGESGIITNAADLAVASGQTLTLVGGDVSLDGGNITAPGGRVELGGLSAAGEIGISADNSLSFPDGIARADITLTNAADVDIRAERGGFITINTRNLELREGSRLLAGIREGIGSLGDIGGYIKITATDNISISGESSQGFRSGIFSLVEAKAQSNSGGIVIDTGSLSLQDGAVISGSTFGLGDGGTIGITAKDNITLEGSGIFSQVGAKAQGNSGGIAIDTGSLSLQDGAVMSGSTFGLGDGGTIDITAKDNITLEDSGIFNQVGIASQGTAGDIIIDTNFLSIADGAFVRLDMQGIGDTGVITIKATDTISLSGEDSQGNASFIVNQVFPNVEGTVGGIKINAGSLSLMDGAQLGVINFGVGNTKAINITATDTISLSGEDSQGAGSGIFSVVAPGAQGNSEGIIINTSSLFLTNGAQLSASIAGIGDAGMITITATDTISLSGEDSQGTVSGIFSAVAPGAQGNSEGIIINTSSLSLTDGALIDASTFGIGNAGKITIMATDTISLAGEKRDGSVSGIFSQVRPEAKGTAEGIRIETGSLFLKDGAFMDSSTLGIGDAGEIYIIVIGTISLSGESSQGFSSGISNRVLSKAAGDSKGISITASSLSLTDGAFVSANTQGEGEAGNIVITAKTLEAVKGAQIQTNTTTNFDAADITLRIHDNLFLSGTDSGLFAQTEGAGKAGNIIIDSPQLTIDQGASISAFTTANGDGGTITVNAPQAVLLTDNSQLTVETSGSGKPGNITITTPNLTIGKDAEISATATATSTNTERGGSITINASNLDLTGKLGIFAETQGVAPAGTLNLQPDDNKPNLDIQFTDTAIISASTTASGQGGDINLTAPSTINITGQGKVAVETTGIGNAGNINITTQNLNLSQQTEISASTFSSGQAGSINITANNFELTEGATVITNTTGSGKAGDIQLQIRDSLNLVNSSIEASTQEESSGDGGSIFIDPQVVTLNNSQIAVNSQGTGTGGNINLQADTLTLENQSAITAETVSTDGGEIELNIGGNLLLRDHSQISATAGTAQAGGDGGNIDINAQFILAFPTEDSNITANAFEGNGGKISITAEGILGIEFRSQPTILSDITASSEFGLAGTVDINTPETDPNRGLVTLSQQAVDTQVALGCDVDGEGAVAFYNLGRGGLSASPDDFLIPDTVIGEWLPLVPSSTSFSAPQKLNFELNGQQRATGIKQLVPPCWQ